MLEGSHGGIGRPQLWTTGQRRLWLFALFMLLLLLYASRTALPIAIVKIAEEREWNKRTSGIILSSFYWGYTLNQVTSGWLADQHGGELVLWVSCVCWSLSTLAMSFAGNMSPWFLFLANLMNGMTQAATYPSLMSLLSVRVCEERRSLSFGIISCGTNIGVVTTGILGHLFLSHKNGWESIFLLLGVVSVLWGLLLRWLSRRLAHKTQYRLQDTSSKHSMDNGNAINVNLSKAQPSCVEIPWAHLMKQKPFLALAYACICQGFFLHNTMAWVPTYFHDSYPDHRDKAWLFNSLPWLCNGVSVLATGWLANKMISSNFTVTTTRRFVEGFSLLGPAISLFALSLAGADHAPFLTALFCIVAAYTLQGMHAAGSSINAIDLSPSHCGAIFGVTNSLGAMPGIIGVSLTGSVLHSTNSWVPVFLIIAAVGVSGGIIFSCFGSGRRLTHPSDS